MVTFARMYRSTEKILTTSLLVLLALLGPLLGSTSSAQAQTNLWAETYGGESDDEPFSMKQTSDRGYIVVGTTQSFGAGGLPKAHPDVWVVKLGASGNIQWQKFYGGIEHDDAMSVQQTSDGGYIVAGETASFGAGDLDAWILKLGSDGGVEWHRTYGGTGLDGATSIEQTSDGGYIVGGRTASFGAGDVDFWVFKLDSGGSMLWEKTYGGAGSDRRIENIHQTADGGYVLGGSSSSFGTEMGAAWILKVDADGDIAWQKTYALAYGADMEDIQLTADGGYVVLTETASSLGGIQDFWVFKLDSVGNMQWHMTYGGPGYEDIQPILQTRDGGYIVSGATTSFGAGGQDVLLVKLESSGNIEWQKTYGGAGDDQATSVEQTSDGGYVVGAVTTSFGAGGKDIWILRLDSSGNIDTCEDILGESQMTVTTGKAMVTSTDADAFDTYAVVTMPQAVLGIDTSASSLIQCRLYAGEIIGVTVVPNPVGRGSKMKFTVEVKNSGESDIPKASVRLTIYMPDGTLAALRLRAIDDFIADTERTVEMPYTLSSTAELGIWTYRVILSYHNVTLLDYWVGGFRVQIPNVRGEIVSTTHYPLTVFPGLPGGVMFTVTFSNTGNIVWSNARITLVVSRPDGHVVARESSRVTDIEPGVTHTAGLNWQIRTNAPTGTYTYDVYLYYGTELLDSSTENPLVVS